MNAKTKLLEKLHTAKLYEKMRLEKELENQGLNEEAVAVRKARLEQCKGYMEAMQDAMAVTCN